MREEWRCFFLVTTWYQLWKIQYESKILKRLLSDMTTLIKNENTWKQYGKHENFRVNIIFLICRVKPFCVQQNGLNIVVNVYGLTPHPNPFCAGLDGRPNFKPFHLAQKSISNKWLSCSVGAYDSYRRYLLCRQFLKYIHRF